MGTETTAARKLMTAEEFYDFVHLPENDNKWFELVRGEVIELPPPQKKHGVVSVNVGVALVNHARQRRKGYVTTNDSGVVLEHDPDTVRGPDVAYYEDAQTWDELHPKYGEVPPRLAVEVLSPNDKIGKVMLKIMDYLKSGVELVWLVDPDSRNVTVYRPNQQPFVAVEGQDLTGDGVLPEFRLAVADLFFLPGQSA